VEVLSTLIFCMKNILDLDSKSAVTIFSSVTIKRDNPREELGMIDLENSISQAIWKLFDGSRREAAERLQIGEVDLLLTDARVMGMKIDGHQVINPHGFKGKELDVILAITMVKRNQFVDETNPIEGGSARAYLLSREKKLSDALYIEIGDDWTTLFSVKPKHISYMSDFNWGISRVIELMRKKLEISESVAREFYSRLTLGDTSPHILKQLEKVFYDAFSEFVDGLAEGIKEFSKSKTKFPPVYLKSFSPLPDSVFRKRFSLDGKQVRLLPTGEGIEVQVFADDELHTTYQELNDLARRRIKWLMPTL